MAPGAPDGADSEAGVAVEDLGSSDDVETGTNDTRNSVSIGEPLAEHAVHAEEAGRAAAPGVHALPTHEPQGSIDAEAQTNAAAQVKTEMAVATVATNEGTNDP